MSPTQPLRILFTGYAPVHFLCFRPLYERLIEMPNVEVFVSGGLRTKTDSGYLYDEKGLYAPLNIHKDQILSVDEIQNQDFDVLFSAHTKLIMPRSVKKKIQIFHGISYRNKSIRPENMGCDYYFLIGPYQHRSFIKAGLLEENDPRAIEVGFMKTDRLVNGQSNKSAIMQQMGFKEDRPLVIFAPTGAKRNAMELHGEDLIQRLSATNKYNVLVKPHDHPKNKKISWFEYLKQYETEHCKVSNELDVIPQLYIADLLISDASSVVNEYSLLDRPIVFIDTPTLIEKAADAKNSMLDLDTWGRKGGMVVDDLAHLEETIDYSLAHSSEKSDIRKAMAEDFFYNPGHATDVAMDWLKENIFKG